MLGMSVILGKLPGGSLPKEKFFNDFLNKQNSQNGHKYFHDQIFPKEGVK